MSDPDRKLIRAFGVDDPGNEVAWPSVVLVDTKNRVAYKHITKNYKNRPPFSELKKAIERADR